MVTRLGSPPHTREELGTDIQKKDNHRITPAYAGRIFINKCYVDPIRDHPRIRGKNPPPPPAIEWLQGSPPHTREEWRNKNIH